MKLTRKQYRQHLLTIAFKAVRFNYKSTLPLYNMVEIKVMYNLNHNLLMQLRFRFGNGILQLNAARNDGEVLFILLVFH
jgi:hypothetical protein